MRRWGRSTWVGVVAFVVVCAGALSADAADRAPAAPVADRYPQMAPVEQYLMDRREEIALARSAAPDAVSQDATVYVLARSGYEKAVAGTNGFVCLVERPWVGALDHPEFWNPKVKGADCYNAPAAHSILPLLFSRTAMVMAGRSKDEMAAALQAGLASHQLSATPEPGAMSYMMAKGSYLTDEGGHNMPHLMFFMPMLAAADWGAEVPNSPVGSASYWALTEAFPQLSSLPPLRVFTVGVRNWSDGTPAVHHSEGTGEKSRSRRWAGTR
jgi:hypothetical protein